MSGADAVLGWLERTALSDVVRQSDWAVMALEAVHLLGLTMLGGAVVIVGIAALQRGELRGLTVTTLVTQLRPLVIAGLVTMVISGSLIALSMPFKYYNNPAFRWKMALLLASVVATVALAHVARTERQGAIGYMPLSRALAVLVLLLWLGVGFSGRLIGFL
jgi:hypothetical protein